MKITKKLSEEDAEMAKRIKKLEKDMKQVIAAVEARKNKAKNNFQK